MNNLKRPKQKIPEFRSEKEAAGYFDSHSAEEFWESMEPAKPIQLPPEQSKAIRERHARRKAAISLRLEPEQITAAKRIAAHKSIGYQTQLRLWIAEGIRRERRKA